jgi:hypothetical protein
MERRIEGSAAIEPRIVTENARACLARGRTQLARIAPMRPSTCARVGTGT